MARKGEVTVVVELFGVMAFEIVLDINRMEPALRRELEQAER